MRWSRELFLSRAFFLSAFIIFLVVSAANGWWVWFGINLVGIVYFSAQVGVMVADNDWSSR